MLRSSVLLIAGVALVCGVTLLFAGIPPALVAVFWGAVIVVSIVYERFRYKPVETGAPGPGWTKTPERFIDDETGEPVTVWLQPETGERKYVRG
jgi:hypothetical protein